MLPCFKLKTTKQPKLIDYEPLEVQVYRQTLQTHKRLLRQTVQTQIRPPRGAV